MFSSSVLANFFARVNHGLRIHSYSRKSINMLSCFTFAKANYSTRKLTSDPFVEKVKINQNMLETYWKDGQKSQFPIRWLRDNCRCDKCFNTSAQMRLFTMFEFEPDVTITDTKVSNEGEVYMKWKCGHESVFDSKWLRLHCFDQPDVPEERLSLNNLPNTLWGRQEMQDKIPRDTFDNIINDDIALYNWLCTMERQGIFLISETPPDRQGVKDVAERVAFLRKTNYGDIFTVKAKVNPSNNAFTSAFLSLHTDLPYYQYCPGVQMLHCIKQVPIKGGENQFADGFFVANQLKEQHPDHYDILSKEPIEFCDIGEDNYAFYKRYMTPIIRETKDGKLTRIAFNDQARGSHMPQTAETAHNLYGALKSFTNLLYHHRNMIDYKLKEGDIICFHNYRVLHGRSKYEVLENGERHLEGGYIDWDEMRSRRRLLQLKYNLKPTSEM